MARVNRYTVEYKDHKTGKTERAKNRGGLVFSTLNGAVNAFNRVSKKGRTVRLKNRGNTIVSEVFS